MTPCVSSEPSISPCTVPPPPGTGRFFWVRLGSFQTLSIFPPTTKWVRFVKYRGPYFCPSLFRPRCYWQLNWLKSGYKAYAQSLLLLLICAGEQRPSNPIENCLIECILFGLTRSRAVGYQVLVQRLVSKDQMHHIYFVNHCT